ncbi:MAG: YcxB family protein [Haloplasmataceae bacterium]|jgi:hypothetical protein|nr:YcxB family protein [Haloplasmataceae bacterium]
MVKFSYTITSEDYYKFNNWFVFEKTNMRKAYNIFLPIIYLCAIYLAIFYEINWITVSMAIILTLIRFLLPLLTKFTAEKNYYANKAIQLETEYIINSENISSKNETATFELKWEDVYSAFENDEYTFIFNAPNSAIIIPKSEINYEENLYIKQLIIEKLPEKKRKRIKI